MYTTSILVIHSRSHGSPVAAIIVVAVMAVAGYFAWQRALRMRQGLTNLAAARGWTFTKRLDYLAGTWQLDPFNEGHSQQCHNVVQGSAGGWPFVSMDYHYTTGSGKSAQAHEYGITALQLAVPMPALSVTPENIVTRHLGRDIQLESEDFNRAFRVKAADPKFAYDVLSARTMQMLLTRPRVSWHFDGAWLVCFATGDLSPTTLLSQLDTATRLLATIPSFVWHTVGAPDPAGSAPPATPVPPADQYFLPTPPRAAPSPFPGPVPPPSF